MPTAGFEIASATRLIAPIVKDIYEGAKGVVGGNFKKWRASGYPSKLAKKIAAADKVKTIWSPEKDISLLSIYYPSKVILDAKKKTIKTIDDFNINNLVIDGIVGQGKSIFLRYLCLQELTGNGTGRIPLFLELRTVMPGKTLKDHLLLNLEKLDIDINDEVFDYLMESGKIALLLDGFDELPDNLVSQSISEIEFLVERYPELKVVITSRPDNEIQKSRLFTVVKIAKLEKSDFDDFLKKLSIPPFRRAEIIDALKKSPREVFDLINTPLMLTLLVMVYESEKEIPSELPEFFEKLFHTVFTKHDKLKAGFNRAHHCGLSERKLQELFEAFCFMVLQNGFSRSLTADQFFESFSQALGYTTDCECKQDDFKKDITKVACLMLEEGFDLTTFLHKSICEYYGAGFIKRSSSDIAELFYSAARERYQHWEEVLYFLQKIDPYRSAKYFFIPVNESILELLNSNNPHRTSQEIIRKVMEFSPGGVVAYAPEDRKSKSLEANKNYEIARFGPFRNLFDEFGHHHKSFRDDVLFEGIRKTVPNNLSLGEIRELQVFRPAKENDNYFEITFANALTAYTESDFLQKFKIFEQRVVQELDKMRKLVQQEEHKKLIFQKKSSIK